MVDAPQAETSERVWLAEGVALRLIQEFRALFSRKFDAFIDTDDTGR